MNIPLLREIQERILAEPDAFRMDTWTCGTAHCIAGWALHLKGLAIKNPDAPHWRQRLTDGQRPEKAAAEVLALGGEDDDEIGVRLFNLYDWPSRFSGPYWEADEDRAARARIAAERIDHFIATNGAE